LVEDPSIAFKDKSDLEIARAWLVFRLCASKTVVNNAPQLLKLSRHAPLAHQRSTPFQPAAGTLIINRVRDFVFAGLCWATL
jgi:hypothetical protein